MRGGVPILTLLAGSWICCSTFTSADETSSGGTSGGGQGAPCWPNGTCPASMGCCIDVDGGSRCTDLPGCPADHARIECRKPTDCTGGTHCCTDLGTAPPESGFKYTVKTNCLSRPCTGFSPEKSVCATNADCTGGTTCLNVAAYPRDAIYECRQ
jgi:hypothetical protein